MEHKKYKIETLQDMLDAITVDNKDQFVRDLDAFFDSFLLTRTVAEIKGKGDQVKLLHYNWIDDGINHVTTILKPTQDGQDNKA